MALILAGLKYRSLSTGQGVVTMLQTEYFLALISLRNDLLDREETAWLSNLSMEKWRLLLICGMWPVLDVLQTRHNSSFKYFTVTSIIHVQYFSRHCYGLSAAQQLHLMHRLVQIVSLAYGLYWAHTERHLESTSNNKLIVNTESVSHETH